MLRTEARYRVLYSQWLDLELFTRTRFNIQDERRENKKTRNKKLVFKIKRKSIARRANNAIARDCLSKFIKFDTITIIFFYKIEFLRNDRNKKIENEKRKNKNERK